jgi:hypothetical protein
MADETLQVRSHAPSFRPESAPNIGRGAAPGVRDTPDRARRRPQDIVDLLASCPYKGFPVVTSMDEMLVVGYIRSASRHLSHEPTVGAISMPRPAPPRACSQRVAAHAARSLPRRPSPPPPSRTKWTRLVHPSVQIGHVSSPVDAAGHRAPGVSCCSGSWRGRAPTRGSPRRKVPRRARLTPPRRARLTPPRRARLTPPRRARLTPPALGRGLCRAPRTTPARRPGEVVVRDLCAAPPPLPPSSRKTGHVSSLPPVLTGHVSSLPPVLIGHVSSLPPVLTGHVSSHPRRPRSPSSRTSGRGAAERRARAAGRRAGRPRRSG